MIRAFYVDPASIFFPPGVYPIVPVYRRSPTLESRFPVGMIDAGINTIPQMGRYEYENIYPPKHLPKGWEFVILDYPWDIIRDSPWHWTPRLCLEKTDEMIRKYLPEPHSVPVLQYLFGNAESLRERLKAFLHEFDVTRWGLGNTCKLRSKTKLLEIGRVLVKYVPEGNYLHIFGCPSFLLDYLADNAKFSFSVDSNKFFFHRGRMASGKEERSLFLNEYLAKHKVRPTESKPPVRPLDRWFPKTKGLNGENANLRSFNCKTSVAGVGPRSVGTIPRILS